MSPINTYKLSAIFLLVTMFMAVNCDTQGRIVQTKMDTGATITSR